MTAIIDRHSGAYSVVVDGNVWLESDASRPVSFFGQFPSLASASIEPAGGKVTLTWKNRTTGRLLPWSTIFLVDRAVHPGSLVLRQVFPEGIKDTAALWPRRSHERRPADQTCGAGMAHTDQRGGHMLERIPGLSNVTACCERCVADSQCNAWVVGPTSGVDYCFLIAGAEGAYSRANRTLGLIPGRQPVPALAGDQNAVVAGFPAIVNGKAAVPLNLISWGGCQLSPGHGQVGTHIGRWSINSTVEAGADEGSPLLLYSQAGRTLMMSPLDNYFVAIHSSETTPGLMQAGVKASVRAIPPGFSHDTLVHAGRGVNDTLVSWGDRLLAQSGKTRVDPYKDFMLGHLGHWNDAGAFYYHNPAPFPNYQEALLAVKADAQARSIPFRYSQWDDWWAYQNHSDFGNWGGVTNWVPMPGVFPDGMTDWLGLPLSLYASSYSAGNVYRQADMFAWNTDDRGHAIPVDRTFYDAIFRNGTAAGMKMFEQDFLCSINTASDLTRTDVSSGMDWVRGMNDAATSANITLQFCMMNPVHTMLSTMLTRVTNGRATRDNHPGRPRDERADPMNAGNGLVLGLSGMLHYAVGIWPSRDNVWTNSSVVGHGGPEDMVQTQTLLAMLSGGPYGPSDGAGSANRTLIMRSCRDDGVLLRADKPITMLDSALLAVPFADDGVAIAPINVWATHSNIGPLRYGYVLGLDLNRTFSVFPRDIFPGAPEAQQYLAWESWHGLAAQGTPGEPTLVNASRPFAVPAPKLAANEAVITSTYHVFSPVLSSGWTFLGEPGKIVAASARRVAWVRDDGSSKALRVCLVGAPGESVTLAVHSRHAVPSISSGRCAFPVADDTGARDLAMLLQCDLGSDKLVQCGCETSTECTVPTRWGVGLLNYS